MLSILDPSHKVTYQSLLSYVLHMTVMNELPVGSHLLFLSQVLCPQGGSSYSITAPKVHALISENRMFKFIMLEYKFLKTRCNIG